MQIIVNPPREEWPRLSRRNTPSQREVERRVEELVEEVHRDGDAALRRQALAFDGVRLEALELTEEEISRTESSVSEELKDALREAIHNIESFHRAQLPAEVELSPREGVRLLQRAVPLERVGLYVPGGGAPLFSTVLMLALPARIAGCKEVVLCTPESAVRGVSPAIVCAARMCGVRRIFRLGGAGAVAAMAYGTESVPRVDKIFGPGNRYVTCAKQLVSRHVAIDMPAGPSEVLVLCDESADARFVAADMLSQAEHGPDSQALAVCSSEALAREVEREVARQVTLLTRKDQLRASLEESRVIVMERREDMIAFANHYASEHLILSLRDARSAADEITAAGSVFIGNYSPESAGDYASGTNHTLPTGGWARACSGVNVDSFMRKITYQELTPMGLKTLAHAIMCMAREEGLDAHAAAVEVRLKALEEARG